MTVRTVKWFTTSSLKSRRGRGKNGQRRRERDGGVWLGEVGEEGRRGGWRGHSPQPKSP